MNIFFLLILVVGFFAAHQPVYCMNKNSQSNQLTQAERQLISRMGADPRAQVPARQYFTSNLDAFYAMACKGEKSDEKKALALRSHAGKPYLLRTGFADGGFYEYYFIFNQDQQPKVSEKKEQSSSLNESSSVSSTVISPIGSISPVPSPEPLNQKALVVVAQPTFDLYKHFKKGLQERIIQRVLSKAYKSGDDESLLMRGMDLAEAFGKLSEKDQKSEVGETIKKLAQGAIERAAELTIPSENELISYARYKNKLLEYDDKRPMRSAIVATQSQQASDQEKKFIQEETFNAALVVAQAAADNQITLNAPAKFDQYVTQGKKEKNEDLLHAATLKAVAVLASHFNPIQETFTAQSAFEQLVAKVLTPAEVLQTNRAMMDNFKTLLSKNKLSVSDARKLLEYRRDHDIQYDITQEENEKLAALIGEQLEENPRETARLLRYLDSQSNQLSLPAIVQLAVAKKIDADTQNYLQGLHFMNQPDKLSYAIEKFEAIKSEKRIEALPYLINCYMAIPANDRTNNEEGKAEKSLRELCAYVQETNDLKKNGTVSSERLELSRQLAYEVAFAPSSSQQATDEINLGIVELQGLYLGLIDQASRAQGLDFYARDCFGFLKQSKTDVAWAQKSLQLFATLKEGVAQPTPIADLFILELQRRMSLEENKDELSKHADWLCETSDRLEKLSEQLRNDDDRKYAEFVTSQRNQNLDQIGQQYMLEKEYDKAFAVYEKVEFADLATFLKARINMMTIKDRQSKQFDDCLESFAPAADIALAFGLQTTLDPEKFKNLKKYYEDLETDGVLKKAIAAGSDKAFFLKSIFDAYMGTGNVSMSEVSKRFDACLKKAKLAKDMIWQIRIIGGNLVLLAHSTEQVVLNKQGISKFNELCNELGTLKIRESGENLVGVELILRGALKALKNSKKKKQNQQLIKKIEEFAKNQEVELWDVN